MASTSCHQFSLSEINEATNNFDPINVIGRGGEGDVYLAHVYLDHHKIKKTPVAVKLLNANSTEFDSEIEIVSKIQHPHLVSLLGYCNDSGHKILIYEYMPKGSLSDFINKNNSIRLSWKQRLNICLGAARGLQHLHSETPELPKGIIHRDVKPANILLDGNWAAKVSDFGMFKLSHAGQTDSAIATGLKGTSGYYAPEYVRTYQITRKIDVYALGVVMFEVLCRQKPWVRGDESYYVKDDEDLGAWAQENVDVEIEEEISTDSLEVFTNVIGSSLQQDSSKRLTMDDVVTDLEHALRLQEQEDEAKKLQLSLGQFTGFRPKTPSTIVLETRAEYEHVDTYVCDVGGAITKVGFSGNDSPEAVFETALDLRFNFQDLENPFEGGIISSWQEYYRVLSSSLLDNKSASNYEYGSEHPVLLMEPQPHLKYNPIDDKERVSYKGSREELVYEMFEDYQIPAVYVADQSVLSLYANGLTTGIVVESGEGLSYSVPIYEGHVLPHAVTSLNLAGQGLTNHFMKTLNFKTSSYRYTEHQIMREMKEKLAYIAIDYNQELLKTINTEKVRYELPDKQRVTLGVERFQCPEALFNPSVIGMDEVLGIHHNTYNSINMCDPEIRDQLYGNIVLSGGSTMIPGFANRMKKEIKLLARRGSRSPIKIWAPDNRMHGAWVGGSVMASLSTFKNICISRAEFREYGAKIVHKKCF